jgi:hypothetical protein
MSGSTEPGPNAREEAEQPDEGELATSESRERRRGARVGVTELEPDARMAELLLPGEDVVALRRPAVLDRREPPVGGGRWPGCPGLSGDLYVTSRRLVHVGRAVVEYDLDGIREAVVSAGRLLLTLGNGEGIILHVDEPGPLRVEMGRARARNAARARAASGAGPAYDRA